MSSFLGPAALNKGWHWIAVEGSALFAISFSADDTQRRSHATADSRLEFCLPSSLSGHWSQKLRAGDMVPAAGMGCCHGGSSCPESSAQGEWKARGRLAPRGLTEFCCSCHDSSVLNASRVSLLFHFSFLEQLMSCVCALSTVSWFLYSSIHAISAGWRKEGSIQMEMGCFGLCIPAVPKGE